MPRAVDVAIVGATGFTGRRVVLELACLLASKHASLPSLPDGRELSFAVVGRSRPRLDAVLEETAAAVPGFDSSRVPVLLAKADDEAALRRVAASAAVVLSCTGPFARLGAPLLDACLAEKTHYVDVAGEPLFMERAELALHTAAQEQGVLLVPGCGFDSVPGDLGAAFAVEVLRAAGATATAVECYLSVRGGPAGVGGHYATLESAVAGLGSVRELSRVRAAKPSSRTPRYGPPLRKRPGPHWSRLARAWALPFIGADASVVRRTQEHLVAAGAAGPYATQLPIQFGAYVAIQSAAWLAVATLLGSALAFLCRFPLGRALVLAYPRAFSAGVFSHAGPSAAQLAQTSFSMTFHVRGRAGSAAEVASEQGCPPSNARAVVRVVGPEPGYVATPRIVLACAFELAESAVRVPARGGVLTPAAAFRGPASTLRARLESLGVRFEVVEPASVLPAL